MTSHMTKIAKQLLALLLTSTSLIASNHAFSLEMGQLEVSSRLNEPLDAQIPLRGTAEELQYAEASIASQDQLKRAGIDWLPMFDQLEVSIVNEKETIHIKITSKVTIKEPLFELLVIVHWENGRAMRDYSVLLSP